MWFRSIQRIGNAGGGGGSAGLVFGTFARFFSRKRAENLRKINPKLTPQEASLVAQDLYGVVKQHGPLTVSNAWIKAQVRFPLTFSFCYVSWFIIIIFFISFPDGVTRADWSRLG